MINKFLWHNRLLIETQPKPDWQNLQYMLYKINSYYEINFVNCAENFLGELSSTANTKIL